VGLILHSEVEDIVRQVVCTDLVKRLVKTLQNSTTPQKCGMSRYPSTSLQKPTGLVVIRQCAVRIRSSFTPNSGMLASASDGCGLNFGRKAQRVGLATVRDTEAVSGILVTKILGGYWSAEYRWL
jgi:hypothetical protein